MREVFRSLPSYRQGIVAAEEKGLLASTTNITNFCADVVETGNKSPTATAARHQSMIDPVGFNPGGWCFIRGFLFRGTPLYRARDLPIVSWPTIHFPHQCSNCAENARWLDDVVRSDGSFGVNAIALFRRNLNIGAENE